MSRYTRPLTLVALVSVLLLLAAVVLRLLEPPGLARAQDAVPQQAGLDALALPYAVEQSTVSGGGYRLASLSWHVSRTASGGGYRLQGSTAPLLQGSGCCCTYLPLSLRGFR